jgi:oligopeptidase B
MPDIITRRWRQLAAASSLRLLILATGGTLLAAGAAVAVHPAAAAGVVVVAGTAVAVSAAVAPPAAAPTVADPPRARQEPRLLEAHGQARVDEFYWLRDRHDAEVLTYLAAENAYLAAVMAPTDSLQEALYEEVVGRIKQDDASVPVLSRGFYYYTRYEEGAEHPLHCRREGSLDAPEQIMLDGDALALGQPFFDLRGVQVSSDNRTLAYAVDTVGRRFYTWRFRDLATGRDLPPEIASVTAGGVWAEDGRTFFYVRQDPVTLRSHQVWRHTLGTAASTDVLVYEEADPTFRLWIGKTKSRQYLLINISQTLADEVRYLRADDPAGAWQIFTPRRRGHEYSIDHDGERFVIRTNLAAPNFRLLTCSAEATAIDHWVELLPHRADVLIERVELLRDAIVVQQRRGGLTRLHIRPWAAGQAHDLDFGEETYAAWLFSQPELDTPMLRYGYSSLTTPTSVFDYDWPERRKILRKQDELRGEFDPAWYESAYLHATADDGTQVPISVVWRRDLRQPGHNPCLLYGYGAYGASSAAAFSAWRLSLLDRGFVFAIAHVRGGQELGRAWYEGGKLLQKQNSFTDFIACGRHLIASGHADPERLYAMGGSAGGLLVAAAMNLAPELWDGVIAQVPFVDVVTTMLDASIPLTTGEYDEWGDPNDPLFHDYMLSYSPYDQTAVRAYPHLLVTAGLHDSQVQYWEPAKWVARLRARKTNDTLLLLSTNLEAGHGGASGRLSRLRERALELAFLIELAGRPAWTRP